MAYSLFISGETGTSRQILETAESAVSRINEVRNSGASVKVAINAEAIEPGDLTDSERLIIIKEGRAAAERKDRTSTCPYANEQRRHVLWLEGYKSRVG